MTGHFFSSVSEPVGNMLRDSVVLLVALIALVSVAQAGPEIYNEDGVAPVDGAGEQSEGNREGPSPVGQAVTYFSNRWRSIFNRKQLQNQAKWRLAEKQPEDGSYEVRIYESQWWISSFAQCRTQDMASSAGYMDLYFYMNGFNYQRYKYPLTYPVLLHVNKRQPTPTETPIGKPTGKPTVKPRPKPAVPSRRPGYGKWKGKKGGNRGKKWNKGKKRKRPGKKPTKAPPKVCPIKHISYIPLKIPLNKDPAKSENENIRMKIAPTTMYYVREYFTNYTSEYCNEQFYELTRDLIKNNIWVDEESWFCAKYEPGAKNSEMRYEVWMKERTE